MDNDVIALFELTVEGERALIVEERHYQLVPSDAIDGALKQRCCGALLTREARDLMMPPPSQTQHNS